MAKTKTYNVLVDTMTSAQNNAFTVNTNDLKSVKLNLLINQDGEPLDLTDATVRLAVKKPDQKSVLQDATIVDALAGSCEIVLDTQAYVIPGNYTAEVMVFYGTDTVAVTSNFAYKANRGIMNDDSVESTNEWQSITQAIADAESIKTEAQTSAESSAASATAAQTLIDGAKGTYPDLSSRLSNVDSQLAEKATQTDLNTTNVNVGLKADKTYVDSNLQNKRDKSLLITMADLAQDVKTGMTGGSVAVVGVNAVNTDNVVNSSLKPVKTTFFDYGKNLFDANAIRTGYGITSTGVIVTSGTNISDKMFVTPGKSLYFSRATGANGNIRTTYALDDTNKIVAYDASGNFIEQNTSSNPYTIPSNVAYVIFQFYAPFKDFRIQIEYDAQTAYEDYKATVKTKHVDNTVTDSKITTAKQDFTTSPLNYGVMKYDKYTSLLAQYWTGTAFSPSTSRATTDYIAGNGKVVKIIDINKNVKSWVYKFDTNKNYLTYVTGSNNLTSDGLSFTMDTGYLYVVMLAYIDNSTIDLETLRNNILYYYTDTMTFSTLISKYAPSELKTKKNSFVRSYAHAGGTISAPENTIPAFQESLKYGFNALEIDVNWTSDNVPVLCHDDTIDRTSTGTGAITSMTYAQLLQYDFGVKKSSVYAGTKIPTLEDTLKFAKQNGLYLYFDKMENDTDQQIGIAMDLVRKYGMLDRVIWNVGLNPATTGGYVANRYSNAIIASSSGSWLSAWTNLDTSANWIKTWKTVYPDTTVWVSCEYNNMTSQNIVDLRTLFNDEIKVVAWTVDNLTSYLEWMGYVDAIISNYYTTDDALSQ